MKISRKKVKSIITKSNLPETDYVINPYIGCQHACIYCYADFMKRFTSHQNDIWGNFVDIKTNAPETIKRIKPHSTLLIGSVTDPYQPIETTEKITRKCLKQLIPLQPKLEILTKSPLILRDIDLLKQFKNLRVGISIGILNESYARQLEPCAPSPKSRIDTIKKLHDAGIRTCLFMSPIFPKISKITPLLDQITNIVEEVWFENLNIRANNQRNIFNFLQDNRPDLIPTYKSLSSNPTHWKKIRTEIITECNKRRLKYRLFFNHNAR